MTNPLKKLLREVINQQIAQRMYITNDEIERLWGKKTWVGSQTHPPMIKNLIRKLYPVIDENTELIRLGPQGDGGYLIPNDLIGIEACFSPGVSTISGFEKDCANLGIKVFMADRSVEKPAEDHELFHFLPKFVGALSNDGLITLDDWVDSSSIGTESDLLLQMDTEGYEYETFLATSSSLMHRFRIMVVEFHWLDELWNQAFFNLAARTFNKILQTHACVHIHPNNNCGAIKKNELEIPHVLEFTFSRRDRLKNPRFVHTFPHPLDYDNAPLPNLALPRCWYSQD